MKSNIQNLALLWVLFFFAACESNKRSTVDESGREITKIRVPVADTVDKQAEPPAQTVAISGTVTAINQGKDGYTATVETAEKTIYDVTVSHSNLDDPKRYRMFSVGDAVSVSGDYWKLGDRNEVTVRRIQ
jgi:hypothetical protein